MYLYREYFKAKVYTIWVHGPLGLYRHMDPYTLNPLERLKNRCKGTLQRSPERNPYLKDEKTLNRHGPIPLYYKSLYGL